MSFVAVALVSWFGLVVKCSALSADSSRFDSTQALFIIIIIKIKYS